MSDSDSDQKTLTPPNRGDFKVDRPETAVLSPSRFRRLADPSIGNGTASLGAGQCEVILTIRGIPERLLLSENMSAVLGRTDLSARFHPEVDLTPYGALERGVSRSHAKLHLEGRKLYVTDLGSTNGTFVGKKRLAPNQPELLHKGDELTVGRLPIQVLF